MSTSTRHGLLCHWRNCSAPGPYGDDKALYDHLNAAHNTKFGSFRCQWRGCARTTPILGRSSGAEHLGTHTDHLPYVCSLPGCGYAVLARQSMKKHIATEHSLPSSATDKLQCLWIRCDQTFAHTDEGASELWEHMIEHHMPIIDPGEAYQCQWGKCTRVFEKGGFGIHLRAHLPRWYRPYKCTICGRAFRAAAPLVRHEKDSHNYRKDTPESEESDGGEGDGRHRKRHGNKRRRSSSDELESEGEDYTSQLEKRLEELESRLEGVVSEQKSAKKKARHAKKDESESKAQEEEEEWALI